MYTNHTLISAYSGRAFSKTKEIIEKFRDFMSLAPRFDTIACMGTSGLSIAPVLSHVFDKKLLIVQKKSTRRHSKSLVDGYINGLSYVIVDDFIESGRTVRKIISTIEKVHKTAMTTPPDLKAIFLYGGTNSGYCENEKIAKSIPVYGINIDFNLKKLA